MRIELKREILPKSVIGLAPVTLTSSHFVLACTHQRLFSIWTRIKIGGRGRKFGGGRENWGGAKKVKSYAHLEFLY